MNVFVCVDSNFGMLFNSRRQSRDRRVCEDMLNESSPEPLYISEFSKSLFLEGENIKTVNSALEACPENGFCFVENEDAGKYLNKINTLTVYCWNRDYPKDESLSFLPEKCGFSLKESVEFKGSSHEKITKEVWVK